MRRKPGARTAARARFVAAQRYIPKHITEKDLTLPKRRSKASANSHRSVRRSQRFDGVDRRSRSRRSAQSLDPVLEMMEAVHRYGGTVNQVMGDGIMALFGAPLALEDHAVRACDAALRCRMRSSAMPTRFSVRSACRFDSGRTNPAKWSSARSAATAQTTALWTDHAPRGAVGQARHTVMDIASARRPFAWRRDMCRSGRRQAARQGARGPGRNVDELTGAQAVRTRLQATASRGLTRFVGRNTELEQLRQAWQQAAQGQGQIVAVIGEAGVGNLACFTSSRVPVRASPG